MMQHMQIAGLPETDRAFRIPGGVVVVRITRGQTDTPDQVLPLKVRCWLADDQGAPLDVEFPAKVETINLSAVSEGALTIEGERARMTVDAITRAELLLAARKAWAVIPEESAR